MLLNRRRFMETAMRTAVLAGLALLGAVLWRRGRRPVAGACVNQGSCRSCRQLQGCHLPLAMRYKTSPWE